MAFLAAAGLPVPAGERLFDTMLAAQVLGAGTAAGLLSHCGLAAVAGRRLGVTLDKTPQTSDWADDLSEAQLAYAARDASQGGSAGEPLQPSYRNTPTRENTPRRWDGRRVAAARSSEKADGCFAVAMNGMRRLNAAQATVPGRFTTAEARPKLHRLDPS